MSGRLGELQGGGVCCCSSTVYYIRNIYLWTIYAVLNIIYRASEQPYSCIIEWNRSGGCISESLLCQTVRRAVALWLCVALHMSHVWVDYI